MVVVAAGIFQGKPSGSGEPTAQRGMIPMWVLFPLQVWSWLEPLLGAQSCSPHGGLLLSCGPVLPEVSGEDCSALDPQSLGALLSPSSL